MVMLWMFIDTNAENILIYPKKIAAKTQFGDYFVNLSGE
jgi:hypothetical protein